VGAPPSPSEKRPDLVTGGSDAGSAAVAGRARSRGRRPRSRVPGRATEKLDGFRFQVRGRPSRPPAGPAPDRARRLGRAPPPPYQDGGRGVAAAAIGDPAVFVSVAPRRVMPGGVICCCSNEGSLGRGRVQPSAPSATPAGRRAQPRRHHERRDSPTLVVGAKATPPPTAQMPRRPPFMSAIVLGGHHDDQRSAHLFQRGRPALRTGPGVRTRTSNIDLPAVPTYSCRHFRKHMNEKGGVQGRKLELVVSSSAGSGSIGTGSRSGTRCCCSSGRTARG